MKQTIFDTSQKAEELLQQAKNIWQSTEHSEYLEGLENDPVFMMLMNALAYQSNETSAEIEQIKTDVIEEFENLLKLDNTGNPIPATVAVQLEPYGTLHSQIIDSSCTFAVNDKKNTFQLIPLLHTKVLNVQVEGIERLDERRWNVKMSAAHIVRDLCGFAFAINDSNYHDLKVSLERTDGTLVPLDIISPEDFSELPMTRNFSIETLLYNRTHAQIVGGGRHGALSSFMYWCAMDLFARQNIRMYFVRWDDDDARFEHEQEQVNLVFEFDGTDETFSFNTSKLMLNTNILINAEVHSANISNTTPIIKLSSQFLHLLHPAEEQIYSSLPLQLRRVSTDRFDRTKMVKLLHNLVGKYHSDFYAFLAMATKSTETQIVKLRDILTEMQNNIHKQNTPIAEGVYLLIDHRCYSGLHTPVSLEVSYLTTSGSEVNDCINDGDITCCHGIESAKRISQPVMGIDAVRGADTERMAARYLLTTGDRLVTPFDIKMFVYNELLSRYNIVQEMVKAVNIGRRQFDQGNFHTYLITVDIQLSDNRFIKRTFAERIPTVEILMQKMIEVRSANAFPVRVNIKME